MEFATCQNVQALFKPAISESTASRYINLVREVYDIKKPKKVPLSYIKDYYGIN